MDQEQRQLFREAVQDVARVLQFESWLRFYFLKEEGETFFMHIPDKALENIRRDEPELAGLAEIINDQEMDYQKSFATVCEYVASRLDGQKYEPGMCTSVFDSLPFKLEVQLFNLWIQAHENQLDESFFDFGKWSAMFWEWRKSDEVKAYLEEHKDELLRPQGQGSPLQ